MSNNILYLQGFTALGVICGCNSWHIRDRSHPDSLIEATPSGGRGGGAGVLRDRGATLNVFEHRTQFLI